MSEVSFNTRQPSLSGFIKNELPKLNLSSVFGTTILSRGRSYANSGHITGFKIRTADYMEFSVQGTEVYTLELKKSKKNIQCSCDCPYDRGKCKHIAAVFIFLQADPDAIEKMVTEMQQENDLLRAHLAKLKPKELIELIVQFAPDDYRSSIVAKAAPQIANPGEKLAQISKSLDRIFDTDRNFNEKKFSSDLLKYLEIIHALWKTHPKEVTELLAKIMTDLNVMYAQGFLYDSYRDEFIVEMEEINNYYCDFVYQSPAEIKFEIINKLFDCLGEFEIFEGFEAGFSEFFRDSELPTIKELLYQLIRNNPHATNRIEKYYKTLRKQLSAGEREEVLKILSSQNTFFEDELIEFYRKEGKPETALAMLRRHVDNPTHAVRHYDYCCKYLMLSKELGYPVSGFGEEMLKKYPNTHTLEFLLLHIPAEKQYFKNLLREIAPEKLFDYHFRHKQIAEATALIAEGKVSKEGQKQFFLTYYKEFPDQAKEVFLSSIHSLLQRADGSAYYEIADLLGKLAQIDRAASKQQAEYIRANYKRRTNLIEIIRKY